MLREMKPLTFQNALRWLIRSEIEPGHGMGSSAAAICASFSALSTLFQKQIDKSQSWPFLTRIESICHGKSSGIDIATSLQGGFLKFQSGEFLSLPPISLENWYLLDSGRPQQSTKECVAHSQEVLAKNTSLLAEMKQTAESFIKKASQLSFEEISRYIRHWHQLQKRLGVVPQSAYRLISHIEGRGASAKVCGAGALAGEGAGLILVLALPGVAHILRKEGLKLEPVEVDNEGSCVTFIG